MTTAAENERMTRVEGDAPLGRLMREHCWIPFALSENLVAGEAPTPVRLFGENFIAFRSEDGRIGFFDELCPHRRASLLLARVEGNGLRCIYHGWKMDVSGRVVECPTQVVRPERFMEGIDFSHFPVHEEGGMAWVWLGGEEAPTFPDLPFAAEHGMNCAVTVSQLPCNWLQGLEGGLDSVHGTILHQTWIGNIIGEKRSTIDTEMVEHAMGSVPSYEAEPAPYGLRTASLRDAGDGKRFTRTTHFFFPLVIVVPTGWPDHTQIFAFAPVDDTHHLLFFGNYGEVKQMTQQEFGSIRPDLDPDPRNFGTLLAGRSGAWGQDRELMAQGHFTGFGQSVIEEDAAVQSSMGPIVDRSRENLSSSDVAVSGARRVILEALDTFEAGGLPQGSVKQPERVRVPHPFEGVVPAGSSWRDYESQG